MIRERRAPQHDLQKAKELARCGPMCCNDRIRRFIMNRYGVFDIRGFLADLFDEIKPENFHKSAESTKVPGVWLDIYRGVEFEDEEWYVKFFIDDGEVRLSILSANWDEYIH